HMASHAAALGISAFAYIYARRHAKDPKFSFGTGKVNSLAGFSSAVLLVLFSIFMGFESIFRFFNPVEILFNPAIAVAGLGLIVNGTSIFVLNVKHHHHEHDSEEGHANHGHDEHSHDHNLMSAYLHVVADALTSVFAILALLAAKYFGIVWMDPLMGIIGAVFVAKWSLSLLGTTSAILLDHQAPEGLRLAVTKKIEEDGDSKVADIHVWSIGPGCNAVIISIVADSPLSPEQYKSRVSEIPGFSHMSVEVHKCRDKGTN
ncbi:MAG TPA: CDF family Co(II)/Ni(II) efflux transporter DmeF, partial [Victivallales bacterium]|nr:CDF family Co(II)/Ni(II) efflux transporter DmeF [Victivallales bacterium]